jgi:hypothetical protein
VIALISASDRWVEARILRRARPTRYVMNTKNGTMTSDSSISCHERIAIATRVETMMTTLAKMEEAVSVTTLWMPPTSFAIRDWISPVLVPVKKRSDIRCRCE